MFKVFVLNPAGLLDAALAIAACRAGATGIFNVEYGADPANVAGALERLSRFADGGYGLKLPAYGSAIVDAAMPFSERGMEYLVVSPETAEELKSQLAEFRAGGGKVIVETTSWSETNARLEEAIDLWWIKGNESGGLIGESSSFVLTQQMARHCRRPFFVRGGINEYSAAACKVAGAAGVVLDDQLLLLRDSPLAERLAPVLQNFSGHDTTVVDLRSANVRIWSPSGPQITRRVTNTFSGTDDLPQLLAQLQWNLDGIVPCGQDAAFAGRWAERYGTVSRAAQAIQDAAGRYPALAGTLNLTGSESAMARSLGTGLPIVQGPMTHVSDRADFLQAVAQSGGLPMAALSLMKREETSELLSETAAKLGDLPWGVGLIGFAPPNILKDQIAAVDATRPPFAIVAGGRPEQAVMLEKKNIKTFLHVPSPTLLEQFLSTGAKRFIFEGRECGGHIGPLGSFSLWGVMIDSLLRNIRNETDAVEIHALFAGGIHDGLSFAMMAAMAAPLAQAGVNIGALMGTSYLFTEEILKSGAITKEFQKVALECDATTRVETSSGHVTRCAVTPLPLQIDQIRGEMQRAGATAKEIRDRLEELVLGRLRLAAKGMARKKRNSCKLSPVSDDRQRRDGLYMIGQAATLKHEIMTVADLHRSVSEEAAAILSKLSQPDEIRVGLPPARPPADIAVVGVGAIMPGAQSASEYWENIVNKVNCISEIPAERWDWRSYFDSDREARDKIYSKWGSFLDEIPFDPMEFGLPPVSLDSIDPIQLLALKTVQQAMSDAGYTGNAADRDVVSVIFGFSGGLGELGLKYAARSELPRLAGYDSVDGNALLPEWTSDSFAGLLPNVISGRAANRFDFKGVNYVVDAACASSLASVYQAVLELEAGRSDIVIAGGADTIMSPFGYLCFSKTQALSPSGRCRTFDAAADGIALGEGVVALVLKRLADAERDGDRVYAVIKGVGGSSDGRAKGLTAPLPKGQERALQRAYEQAGYAPSTLELLEAHGTGTVVGDRAELDTVINFLRADGAPPASCAIGSVKTMIGHTKACAGIAGMLKAVYGLYHHILPPHFGVTTPNEAFTGESPVYISQEPKPWVRRRNQARRAGVSSFGFGGTNFHVTLEEYQQEYRSWRTESPRKKWPAELFVWRAADQGQLSDALRQTAAALDDDACASLRAISERLINKLPAQGLTAAVVASDIDELKSRIATALDTIANPDDSRAQVGQGVFYRSDPLARDGKLAILFSGQGAQYPDMIRELATFFPEVLGAIEESDEILADTPTIAALPIPSLARVIYPPDRFTPESEKAARAAITRTEIAQPALGALASGLWSLVRSFGVMPDMLGGHSYGEFAALHAAGVLSREDLLLASEARGRFIAAAGRDGNLGTMAAVPEDGAVVKKLLNGLDGVVCANINAPNQTIISGSDAAIEQAVKRLSDEGVSAKQIPVAAAFHSPLMKPASAPLRKFLRSLSWGSQRTPVYGNASGKIHSTEPAKICESMCRHLTRPVNFQKMIDEMYGDGARIFVELGPKSILANLTGSILQDRRHVSIAIDGQGGGLKAFLSVLATLAVNGAAVNLQRLFEGRGERESESSAHTRTAADGWLLTGGYIRRAGDPPPGLREAETLQARRAEPTAAREAPPRNGTNGSAGDHFEDQGANVAHSSNGEYQLMEKPTDKHWAEVQTSIPVGSDPAISEYFQVMKQFLAMQERLMMAYIEGGTGSSWTGDLPIGQAGGLAGGTQMLASSKSDVPAPGHTMEPPSPRAAGQMTAVEQAAPSVGKSSAEAPPEPMPPVGEPAVLESRGNGKHTDDSEPAGRVEAPRTENGPDSHSTDFKSMLLKLASERTGYPEDMLDMDLDMEADLGIDSIKRAEILGGLRKVIPANVEEKLKDDMESLAQASTLQEIVNLLEAKSGTVEEQRPFELAGEDETVCAPLPRYVIEAQGEPADDVDLVSPEPGCYIVAPDHKGVGEIVGRQLADLGAHVEFVPDDALCDAAALETWLRAIRELGPVRGLVHLCPLDNEDLDLQADPGDWENRKTIGTKLLFKLLRGTGSELSQGGRALTVSGSGGLFCRDATLSGDTGIRCPIGPGNVGLIKALSLEWTDCLLKAVDLDPLESPEALAKHVVRELLLPGGRREVGYPGGQRTVFRTVPASLRPQLRSGETPGEDWVVVAFGGARGITSEVLREMAAARPTIILAQRTLEIDDEAPETRDLFGADDIRAHFVGDAKTRGERATPAAIEKRVVNLLQRRETRQNVEYFRSVGARIECRPVDVCNASDVARLVESIYAEYGRIDVVLFGAGIIEDQLLVKKSDESFERVYNTKVDGAYWLARHLKPETLKFVAFFTSVAGRYGNAGQADYAAANETLNRLACQLRAAWGDGVKIASVNWGPWTGTTNGAGMVTPEVYNKFKARGVQLIEPGPGRRFLFDELLYGPSADVEIVAGDNPWEYEEAIHGALPHLTDQFGRAVTLPLPLLCRTAEARQDDSQAVIVKTIDLVSDPYLDQHRVDGIPVLPFAAAIEYMAEAVAALDIPNGPVSLRNVQMLKGIRLTDGPVRLEIRMKTDSSAESIDIEIWTDQSTMLPAYRGSAEVCGNQGNPGRPIHGQKPHGRRLSVAHAYNQWLFHGPMFQTVTDILGADEKRLFAVLRPSQPRDLYPRAEGNWIYDVAMLDGAFQLVLVWSRALRDTTALPTRLGRIEKHHTGQLPDRCGVVLEIRSDADDPAICCDIEIFDESGTPLVSIKEFEGMSNAALNRIGGGWAGGTERGS